MWRFNKKYIYLQCFLFFFKNNPVQREFCCKIQSKRLNPSLLQNRRLQCKVQTLVLWRSNQSAAVVLLPAEHSSQHSHMLAVWDCMSSVSSMPSYKHRDGDENDAVVMDTTPSLKEKLSNIKTKHGMTWNAESAGLRRHNNSAQVQLISFVTVSAANRYMDVLAGTEKTCYLKPATFKRL